MTAAARGDLAEAVDCYRRGLLDEAADRCAAVLARRPADFDAIHLLGVVRGFQGRLDDALVCFARAVKANARSAQAFRNLAVTQARLRRHDEAIGSYRKALALGAKPGEVCADLGRSLAAAGKAAEAAEAFARAVAAEPDKIGLRSDLAATLAQAGRHDEAASVCRRALDLAPGHANLSSLLTLSQLRACDWSDLEVRTRDLIDLATARGGAVPPFALLAVSDDPAIHLAAARNFAARAEKPAKVAPPRASNSGGRIRIAYLSADFHEHATAHLMAEMFERHDRDRFDVLALSYGRNDGSAMRKRLERAFTAFVDVRGDDDARVADRIREMGVDIAVDLKGHTQDNRLGILASRPAPVQVHYIGYPGTLGTDFIDYLIADPVVVPPSQSAHYAEKLVRLPGSYQVNDGKRAISARTPSRAECGLPPGAFVFCCFNNSYKILPRLFDAWMRLLHAVPTSVLWLLADNRAERDNLWLEAEKRGVARQRLVFAPRVKPPEHLARHRLADLFLDTWPFNAHTTASDALWAGLPVLTLTGRGFAACVAASLLHAVGLPELVVPTIEDYESLAVRLARGEAGLSELRSRLANNLAHAPLFDAEGTTRQIERAYIRMHEIAQRGEPPRSFAVE